MSNPKKTEKKKPNATNIQIEEEALVTNEEVVFLNDEFEFKNKARYVGSYSVVEGVRKRCGFGKMRHPKPTDGLSVRETYEGEWLNDNMAGLGKYSYANGDVYEGEFKDNLHEGFGKYFFADGSKYFGHWENHMMHGMGDYWDVNGIKWSGEFKNGIFMASEQLSAKDLKRIKDKMDKIKQHAEMFKQQWDTSYASVNKKTAKDELTQFFADKDNFRDLLKGPFATFDDRSYDKHNAAIQYLMGSIEEVWVVDSKKKTLFVDQDEITTEQFGDQLEKGQLVEMKGGDEKRAINLALVFDGTRWLIYKLSDSSEKKK